MMLWAIRTRYLDARDNKWHQHTTKWYSDSEDVWRESDLFLTDANALESSSSLIHKNF